MFNKITNLNSFLMNQQMENSYYNIINKINYLVLKIYYIEKEIISIEDENEET